MADRVNYDQIAPTYNRRYVANKMPGVITALSGLAKQIQPKRLLDVGCGTGYWLSILQPVVPSLYGLDLSPGMLQQARSRSRRIGLAHGQATELPFAGQSFDLMICVNALHHFSSPQAFIAEARRLLRSGGALAIIGMDPHGCRDRWYLYDYFEETYEIDMKRFPSWGAILDWMTAAGFGSVEWKITEQIKSFRVGRDILGDPFLEKSSTSQLVLLSDEAYEAGLTRLKAAIAQAEAEGRTLTFVSDFPLGMVVGYVN
jgi:ubiquinone/menaquinone biosynthesis C-methylase UbiE